MLDEQDSDAETLADDLDGLHQLLGLVRVHTGCRLVEQQQLGLGRERTRDFELALLAVRQVGRAVIRDALQTEHA